MKLEPELTRYIAFCEEFDSLVPAPDDVAAQRERYAAMCRAFAAPPSPAVQRRDEQVAAPGRSVPVRLYRPAALRSRACCLFVHGGGWVLGDLDSHDDWASEIAERSGAMVVSVDYRRSPEHRYPDALEDVYAVLCHLQADARRLDIDADRIVVYGDSSGGNLCAGLALLARDRGGPPIRGQVLVYPALCDDGSLQSYRDNAEGPLLSADAMAFFWCCYLGDVVPDGYAVPVLAASHAGLPPAFIVVAEYDPLRDDGLHYAERLEAAGVAVEVFNGRGLVHGCFRARNLSPLVRIAFDTALDRLEGFQNG
jgi:acetyl esterase